MVVHMLGIVLYKYFAAPRRNKILYCNVDYGECLGYHRRTGCVCNGAGDSDSLLLTERKLNVGTLLLVGRKSYEFAFLFEYCIISFRQFHVLTPNLRPFWRASQSAKELEARDLRDKKQRTSPTYHQTICRRIPHLWTFWSKKSTG